MRNLVLTGLLLLLSGTWVLAQTSSSSSSSMGSSANETSIQGCLSGSSGDYSLTDNSGTTYQLQGDDSQLSKHVGEEISVKGSENAASTSPSSASPSSSASSSTSSTSSTSAKSFNVSSVKKIASTCTKKNK